MLQVMLPPAPLEEDLHRAMVDYLRLLVPPPPDGPVWYHPYNGGYRTTRDAGVGKALGVKAGIGDLQFVWHDRLSRRPFQVEIKRPGEYLSPNQKRVAAELLSVGIHTYVARSIEDLEDALRAEGVPMRRSR